MYTARRKPKCHTCGNFMEGHKRVQGVPICPDGESGNDAEKSLLSPPPSPERESSSSVATLSTASSHGTPPRPLQRYSSPSTEALKLSRLPGGGWHRRNPNWKDGSAYDITTTNTPPLVQRVGEWRGASPSGSVATDLLDDDGHTIRDDISIRSFSTTTTDYGPFDDDDNASDSTIYGRNTNEDRRGSWAEPDTFYPRREPSRISRLTDYALRNTSAVAVFKARHSELEKIERTAQRHGIYATTMKTSLQNHRPSPSKSSKTMVVLGKSASFVNHIATNGLSWDNSDNSVDGREHSPQPFKNQRQRQTSVAPESTLINGMASQNRKTLITFFHLILASILGGCIVVYGMSFLPVTSAATQLT